MTPNKPSRAPHPLWALTHARLVEFLRDPSALFWVFGFPVLLAVALGIAFRNQPPEAVKAAWVGERIPAVTSKITSTPGLQVTFMSRDEARRALTQGKIDVVVENRPSSPKSPTLVLFLDPSRPGAVQGKLMMEDTIQRSLGRVDKVEIKKISVTEPGGRYIDFLLPGLIGLNIMGSCMWGMGYAIVDSRRRRLLRRFAVTPMHRAHFLLSYILSRLLFLIAEVAVLVVFGILAFGVKVHGSIVGLCLLSLVGTLSFSGLAILIAARTESTEVASGWMNFVQLPMWLLSGSFFSYARFPEVLHPIIKALPLTALNDAMRGVINEGWALPSTLPALLILAAWAVGSFYLALRLFKWQ